MKYLHTMIRVQNLDTALDFFITKLGMKEVSRKEVPEGKYTLVFVAADEACGAAEEAGGVGDEYSAVAVAVAIYKKSTIENEELLIEIEEKDFAAEVAATANN